MSLLTRPSRVLSAGLLSLGLLSSAAWAQTPSQDYRHDIQRCEQFKGDQRTTCRREAGAALQAERQHKLVIALFGFVGSAAMAKFLLRAEVIEP